MTRILGNQKQLKKERIYVILSYRWKKNYLLLECKKEEKDGKVVGWEAFPQVPPETIIIQKSKFLAASTLFIVPRLKEKMLYDTPDSHHRCWDRPHL